MPRSWRRVVLSLIVGALAFPTPLTAQSQPDLSKSPGNEWLTVGVNLANQRYSTLDQITPSNVSQLKGQWVTHLGSGLGAKYSFEGSPIVQDGVMYIATGNDDIFALDARTGAEIWEYHSNLDQSISTVCCGWDNRGVAVGGGLVYAGLLDGSFIAVDQKTGQQEWKTQVGRWQDGYTITAAPRYFDGMVFTGISGADKGTRGKLTALDAKTGQELWHFWTIPGPGEFGGDTWPDDGVAYLHGGASIWNTPAIDPELGLLYFSTGNAGPDYIGSVRPGDNLFSSSIVALDYHTGQYKWHFQEVHHDLWDYDAPSPVVLFDTVINGQPRKGLGEPGKTGFVYLLDRTDGKPLVGIEERPVAQEPRQATAATQPYPVGDAVVPQCAEPLPGWPNVGCIFTPYYDVPVVMKPWLGGGTNWAPSSFSPQTGLFYVTAGDQPSAFVRPPESDIVLGPTGWTGTRAASPLLGAQYRGTYSAVDVTTNKLVWQKQMPYRNAQGSGTLSTAGGLLFHGEPDGTIQALDARTGNQLWSWQTGYGADGPVMTYQLDGQQYVAIAAGGISLAMGDQNGDAVWTFTLNGKLSPFPAPKAPVTSAGFTGAISTANTARMLDFSFDATRIEVKAGTTVTWTNAGAQPHTATSVDGGFDTGLVAPGATGAVTLSTPGTFTYTCTPHPWMIGQIIVDPAT